MAKFDQKCLRLYLVTDDKWLDENLLTVLEQAVRGGVSMLQLRAKHLDSAQLGALATKILPMARAFKVPLVINDDIRTALECGADGVHIGQSDMHLSQARRLLGDTAIIGVSVDTVDQAAAAQRDGADYLGVGAMFGTATKSDASTISLETLSQIVRAVQIPVVAIGGIDQQNIHQLAHTGISGVAVVSAIFGASDPCLACQRLRHQVATITGE